MKKSKIIGIIVLCILTTILTISTRIIKVSENDSISNKYKNISHYSLKDFINMDLGLIGYFPQNKHWRQSSKYSRLVPVDSLRYIDSLDITKLADTLYVKVYSQNYAYQSKNIYKIAKNKNEVTDTLMVFNIDIDLRMKDIISDALTFRIKNFTVDYVTKQNIDNVDKRIIFNKNYR